MRRGPHVALAAGSRAELDVAPVAGSRAEPAGSGALEEATSRLICGGGVECATLGLAGRGAAALFACGALSLAGAGGCDALLLLLCGDMFAVLLPRGAPARSGSCEPADVAPAWPFLKRDYPSCAPPSNYSDAEPGYSDAARQHCLDGIHSPVMGAAEQCFWDATC